MIASGTPSRFSLLLRCALPIAGVVVMAVGIYLLNRWCVPFSDDLLYALEGENTSIEGTAHQVSSLTDVVRIQVNDYVKGPNGRIFLHSLVTAFCAFGGHGLFDVLNTGMWFLLVFLILRESGVRGHCLAGSALVFAFLWRAETCCESVAFAVNYLWSAVLTIVYLRLWRDGESWWMVPLSFLFGWWQEAFSLPMVAALGACGVVRSWTMRRFAWTGRCLASYLSLAAGTLGCVGGHFLSGRVADAASNSWVSLLVLAVWPAVLLACLAALAVRGRHQLVAWIRADLEWWMYFAAAAGMFVLIGRQGLRLAMPMQLAALVICLEHRDRLQALRRFVPAVVAFSLVWIAWGACVQHRLMEAYGEMLSTYRADRQGLTFRRPVATGLLDGTVCSMTQSPYYYCILRQAYRHRRRPIVLPPALYGEVMRVSETNRTYVLPAARRESWNRRLPGRLMRMFPDETWHQWLPADSVEVTDPSGRPVTIRAR